MKMVKRVLVDGVDLDEAQPSEITNLSIKAIRKKNRIKNEIVRARESKTALLEEATILDTRIISLEDNLIELIDIIEECDKRKDLDKE